MKLLQIFFTYIKKFFFDSEKYIIYTLDDNLYNSTSNNVDPEVKVYNKFTDIPIFLRKQVFGCYLLNPMYYRIEAGQAKLLAIHTNLELISYGWIQSWKPFKRKFGWFYEDATMLGPYWTNIIYRGKGIYGRMLKHSIAISEQNLPLIIYTTPDNLSSQKGIEKIGFRVLGTYEIILLLRSFCLHEKIN